MDTIWFKLIGGLLLVGGIFYAGWHEASIIKDAELSSYKASVAQAQSTQATAAAQIAIKNSQDLMKSEQNHAQAITTISQFYSHLLQQRTGKSSGSVPSHSQPPTRIAEVPTDALPLAGQCAITTQDYETLYNRVQQYQQNSNPPAQ